MPCHNSSPTFPSDIERTCEQCGAIFYARRWTVVRGGGRYCRPACFTAHQRSLPRKSGQLKNGYPLVEVNEKLVLEHRVLMERLIRRPLRSDEHVHHVNGDRTDNRIENLRILTRAEHMSIHAQPRVAAAKGRPCRDCGAIGKANAGRGLCWGCYMRERRTAARGGVPPTPVKKLTPDAAREIRRLRPTHTLRELAEQFGVTQTQISRVARGESWRDVA